MLLELQTVDDGLIQESQILSQNYSATRIRKFSQA